MSSKPVQMSFSGEIQKQIVWKNVHAANSNQGPWSSKRTEALKSPKFKLLFTHFPPFLQLSNPICTSQNLKLLDMCEIWCQWHQKSMASASCHRSQSNVLFAIANEIWELLWKEIFYHMQMYEPAHIIQIAYL